MQKNGMTAFRFCHPGTLISLKDISEFPKRFESKDPVLQKALRKLEECAKLSYAPMAIAKVNIGPYGAGQGHKEVVTDGQECYHHAIMYLLTRKVEHAKKVMEIWNAWITRCDQFDGGNAPLEAGWAFASMVRAAEILKHVYDGWAKDAGEFEMKLNNWLDRIIMPRLQTKITWINNWNFTILEARMQIAIFRDDTAGFQQLVDEFKRILPIYVQLNGRTSETTRDGVHFQFGLGSIVNICEMAYHQGVFLYRIEGGRILNALEYHAYILNGGVPADVKKEELKDLWFMPCGWEVAYRHYVGRLNIVMPETKKLLEKKRPEWCCFCWGLGTVTHYQSS